MRCAGFLVCCLPFRCFLYNNLLKRLRSATWIETANEIYPDTTVLMPSNKFAVRNRARRHMVTFQFYITHLKKQRLPSFLQIICLEFNTQVIIHWKWGREEKKWKAKLDWHFTMCSAVITPSDKRTDFQLRTMTCKRLYHWQGYFLWAKMLV